MSIVVAFLHFGLIFYIGYGLAKRWDQVRSKLYWSAFGCHLLAGASVGLVYLYYYSANDTWYFFEGATQLSKYAHEDAGAYVRMLFCVDNCKGLEVLDNDFRSLIFIKIL